MPRRLEDMTEPELGAFMRAMADTLKWTAGYENVEPPLFVLLIFNDPQIAQYIANCNRGDTIKALRETADRLERKQTVERIPFPDREG